MREIAISAGERFGRLVILQEVERTKKYHRRFECQCDCGKICQTNLSELRGGHTTSCGCWMRQKSITHGGKKSVEYRILMGVIQRCHNPKNPDFYLYGERGITVCREWRESFSAFFAHIGKRPGAGYSIDRYPNNDGNYEPGNVRWATAKEQQWNTRKNIVVEYNGERRLLVDVCQETGIGRSAAGSRRRRGVPDEKLFLPIDLSKSRKRITA